MSALCGLGVRYYNSVVVTVSCETRGKIEYTALEHAGGLSERNNTTIQYVDHLVSEYADMWFARKRGEYLQIIFQGDDRPTDQRSASWQSQPKYSHVCLLPDFYYVNNTGYTNFLIKSVIPWKEKESKFFWRGSTTGGWNITLESLNQILRYKLCRASIPLGDKADFGICNVAQTKDAHSEKAVTERLVSEGFYKPYIPLESYGKYKFFIQIDGNGNSWELIRKLRLGSCMILVDSPWILWHSPQIRPWEHYVPVSENLNDLRDVVDWCLLNDGRAEEIARRGREFALSIDYRCEMQAAAMALLCHADVVA
jgi:hypothetical protein